MRGTLTDSVTREAVGGGVVAITDSGGRLLARSVVGADGRYAMMRTTAARRLRVVRIGYRPVVISLGADSLVNIRMQPLPPILSSVVTSEKRICPGETGSAGALELWDQARAGLLASVISREMQPPRILLRSFWKTLDPIRKSTVHDSVEEKDVVADRSYVAARPAWAFAESGYMREGPGGARDYFAPDEAVLLDPSFADTHCLHVVQGTGTHASEIGIAFDPVVGGDRDTIVDIAGALWLDRNKPALRAVEFHYTNLEPEGKDAGGEIRFVTLPTGVAMIDRWRVRTPILAFDERNDPNGVRRRPAPRPQRTDVRLLGFRDTGGEVGYAQWPDGTAWQGIAPWLAGRIVDMVHVPVRGARVWMRNGRDTVTTDGNGVFKMPRVFPGKFVVMASDSALAPAGVARSVPLPIQLFQSGEHDVEIELHSRAEVLPLICPAKSYKPGTGVLVARVVNASGVTVPNARIEVETQQLVVVGDTLTRRVVRTGAADDEGRFFICGVARDKMMILRASKGQDRTAVAIDEWADDVANVTLVLRPPG